MKDGTVVECDVLVGADGIRSTTRKIITGERGGLVYLDVFVMLGIFEPPKALGKEAQGTGGCEPDLLDGSTVFQMSDGTTRFYAMPYDTSRYMWQLSFPARLEEAEGFGADLKGCAAEKCRGFRWVEEMIASTEVGEISGYPVYDREVAADFRTGVGGGEFVTVIGDAAHPMSPFKGQGANQGLIDALKLGRIMGGVKDWGDGGKMGEMLGGFEREMQSRAGVKVAKSREAAKFLHTDVVLEEGDVTRGGMEGMKKELKRKM
ncbi:hypothetical protein TrRE_jg8217 [Triparma retinervis]|uniref:FAD-binding domain-containing protein n=1 Tax=Triparma retinervis TaxID=2557542 RepID=A0A9W6ZF51_9STRA|nr:hypothetical protein TrRE_jg8217 [Triparma retinervis]